MENKNLLTIAQNFNIGGIKSISKFGKGTINDTYLVKTQSGSNHVLQKQHKVFKPFLLNDIEVITSYLHKKGFTTPRVIKTTLGKLYLKKNGDCWRMLTYIPGKCFEQGLNAKLAFSAATLMGNFHATLSNLNYEFKHQLVDFHNTPAKISKLKKILQKFKGTSKYKTLYPLSKFVLDQYEDIEKGIDHLPNRIIHGDLKINNVRFDARGTNAIALLDLDTIARHKIVIDLGDAVRTWCNQADEGDYKNASFDINLFKAMVDGYLSSAKKFITSEEIAAIPEGIETILLEISARFITDAFEESYFKLDSKKYSDLFEQNQSKARAQINLYKDFQKKKGQVVTIINTLCKQLS